uniref:Beta-glucosidase n=1 Tax=Acrobeloides nanus TaxID=290746 RepID=A0A914EK07_9BILA
MKDRLLEKSKDEGRIRSRLPEFTKEETKLLKDEYTSNVPIDDLDGGFVTSMDPKWKQIDPPRGYVVVNPEALKEHLNYIKEEYGNPKVMITENGCMDHLEEGMNDLTRIEFVQAHLVVLAQAIEEGCNVIGYTLWSLMDNFEWTKGYTLRFGIYHIDFNDPELKRTPKASASWYKKVIKDRAINVLVEDKNAISEHFQQEVHGAEI